MQGTLSPRAAPSVDVAVQQRRRAIVATVIGNGLEWFDFTVYSFFSPMIGKAFFPAGNELTSLLLALATFGVGFALRPVGAVVIGHYADRSGRRAALSLVILMMAVGTAIVAFTPSYAQIGAAAPILIVLARLIQGFSVGGEFGGATAMLIESAPNERRGLYASWQYAGQALAALAGSLFGVVLANAMTPAEIDAWGWRLPFIFGLMIAPIGLYLRAGMTETAAFARAKETAAPPLLEIWRGHRGSVAISFGVTILGTAVVYLVVFYMPTYATKLLGIPARAAFLAATVSSLLYFAISPLAGRLSDRIGRTRLVSAAALGLTLVALPFYRLLTLHPDGTTLLVVQGLLASLLALFAGPSAALIGELFPPEVRSTGISIGYNAAVPLFGGFAPYFVTRLDSGDHLAPAWYIIVCALPTFAALAALLRKRSGQVAVVAIFLAVAIAGQVRASEIAVTEVRVPAGERTITARLYAAPGDQKRPTVIIVHGASGIDAFAGAYDGYARLLAQSGIDTLLPTYYTSEELAAVRSGDQGCMPDCRYESWARLLISVIDAAIARKGTSGKIGLLGFSRGGYLAVETAALDPRISALVVFYGGIPPAMRGHLTHLPPLLALHGEADRNVPISEGRMLVEQAKAIGGRAELVAYQDADHGFDFVEHAPAAEDARARAIRFLRTTLGAD